MTKFFDRHSRISQTILDENVNKVKKKCGLKAPFLKLSIHSLADTVEKNLILI